MSDVKWIKIVTDIFDDSKILLIEKMPDSYAIIVAWFKLLCLAGKENNGGVFRLNNRLYYNDEMLSSIFRMPIATIRLALTVFEEFDMIEIIENVITIPNWEKHQSEAKLETIREYNRIAKQNEREKKKLLLCQGHVIDCQDTELDKELDKDNNICSNEQGLFDLFWSNYPKKVSKQTALKAFKKLKPTKELTDLIIASVNEHKNTNGWKKENGQFIPYPATFLNAHGWEDEIIPQNIPKEKIEIKTVILDDE